jgi:hypothetical protein
MKGLSDTIQKGVLRPNFTDTNNGADCSIVGPLGQPERPQNV